MGTSNGEGLDGDMLDVGYCMEMLDGEALDGDVGWGFGQGHWIETLGTMNRKALEGEVLPEDG